MTDHEPALATESEDVFAALGDGTRLRILLELAERGDADDAARAVAFSELRRAVDVADAGRFNYHLDELQDTFVTKDEDGYRITVAGLEVAAAIHAGRFARRAETDDTRGTAALERACPTCGGPLTARYEEEVLLVDCPEDHHWFSFPVPAGAAAERSTSELLDVAVRRSLANLELARTGLCPRCWGEIDVDVSPASERSSDTHPDCPRAQVECGRCWLAYHVPLPALLGSAPPVVAFYQRHGLTPEDAARSASSITECSSVTYEPADDPPIQLRVELGAATLHLELAADCTILSSRRGSPSDG